MAPPLSPPAPFLLSITLCEGRHYEKRRVVLYKRVAWPAAPREGDPIAYGRADDGSDPGCTATVTRVFWLTNGDIHVEAEDQQLRDEYDLIVADARRDGFTDTP